MYYFIDIIILFIIALTTFIGYKKGLIKVAFKLVSFVLAIIISVVLYKPISSFIINKTTIDDNLETTISQRLSSSDTSKDEKENILSSYYSDIKNYSTNAMAHSISIAIINIGCILIVFIISNLILLLFKFSGDLIAKLPIIKQFNSAGGFLYGLVKGFLIIYIFLAIVALIAPITDINNFVKIINSSIITNIMYNNNIILILFT